MIFTNTTQFPSQFVASRAGDDVERDYHSAQWTPLLASDGHPREGICRRAGEPNAFTTYVTKLRPENCYSCSLSRPQSQHAPCFLFLVPSLYVDLATRAFWHGMIHQTFDSCRHGIPGTLRARIYSFEVMLRLTLFPC